MKKISLLMMVLLLSVVFVSAQQRQRSTPEERAKRQTEELTTALGLNKDQVAKVEAIGLKFGKKMSELMQSAGEDRSAMREKMAPIQAEQTKEIKALLTKDQVVKYDKYLEEQQQRRSQGRGNN